MMLSAARTHSNEPSPGERSCPDGPVPARASRTAAVANAIQRWFRAARRPGEPGEAAAGIRGALLRSLSPHRGPTSRELGMRLPLLARALEEHTGKAHLSDTEACAILEAYVAQLLDLRLRERLLEALDRGPAASRRRRGSSGYGLIVSA